MVAATFLERSFATLATPKLFMGQRLVLQEFNVTKPVQSIAIQARLLDSEDNYLVPQQSYSEFGRVPPRRRCAPIRATGARCEGRTPYGTRIGESLRW